MGLKKLLLLVDGNEDRLSVRTFLLETYGFDVIPVLTAEQAEIVLTSAPAYSLEGMVVMGDLVRHDELIAAARCLQRELRVLDVSFGPMPETDTSGAVWMARAFGGEVGLYLTVQASAPVREWMAAVWKLTAGKRGPRSQRRREADVAAAVRRDQEHKAAAQARMRASLGLGAEVAA
jgi:two-component system response regulator CpxR